ncbi:MAG TPA: alpha/beta fold hydrolase [Solirubrobacteraceae bacterium]|nr:alpha/beta fold hydrolase [Solirubrobacteraceae bacterium]
MAIVEGAGVPLACFEQGSGPAVLLVHGMADRAAGWEATAADLAQDARAIAYDRRGYGESGAPEPYERTTAEEQAEDAAALLISLDAAPAVVCGRDFGALVCLDLCKRHAGLVRAAVLLDAPVLQFSAAAAESLSDERVALEEALRDGGPQRGVDAWLDARGEPADSPRRTWARADHAAFFADYGGLASWPVTRAELRALAMPLVVLTSPGASGPVREAADALAGLVPVVRREEGADGVAAIRAQLADAP